jgi:hypothetical protein
VIDVEIRSVSQLSEGSALVRFASTRRDPGAASQPSENWVAVIRYRYSSVPMSADDRLVNPLGLLRSQATARMQNRFPRPLRKSVRLCRPQMNRDCHLDRSRRSRQRREGLRGEIATPSFCAALSVGTDGGGAGLPATGRRRSAHPDGAI